MTRLNVRVTFSSFTQLVPPVDPVQEFPSGAIIPINSGTAIYYPYGDGSASHVTIAPDCISTLNCVQTDAQEGPPLVQTFSGALTVSFDRVPGGTLLPIGTTLNFESSLVFYFPPSGIALPMFG